LANFHIISGDLVLTKLIAAQIVDTQNCHLPNKNQVLGVGCGVLTKVDLSVVANSKQQEFLIAFLGQLSAH